MRKTVFVGIGVLVLIFLCLAKRGREGAPSPANVERDASSLRASLSREAHLRALKISKGSIDVRLVPRKWCSGGDLDMIRMELDHSSEKRILLTVESLRPDDASFPPMVRTVAPSELFAGTTRTFRLSEKTPDAFQFGLYLCKDDSHQGECRRKPAADPQEIFMKYQTHQPGSDEAATDKTYFFQYVLMPNPGNIEVFEPNRSVSEGDFSKLLRYVGTFPGLGGAPANLVADVREAKERTLRVQSLALEGSGAGVEILLPEFDGDACRAGLK